VSDAVADADPFTDDEAVIKLEVPSSIGQGGCETFNSKDRRWNFTFYGDRMGSLLHPRWTRVRYFPWKMG
jgi:hypothetical protein